MSDERKPTKDDARTVGMAELPTAIAPSETLGAEGPRHDSMAFSPGEILAERYRVIRFIARGGMGEVYEVEDLTLHGRLALKTIRPEIAQDPMTVKRFKREINVARRITHPNVSRIYDIGVHHAGSNATMFLTMEFLAGEMLGQLILRKGRLTEAEALPIAEQIAAGLAAAHKVGIIHRDFKSSNVMLVPALSGQGTSAVVTDFGLARSSASEEGIGTLSEVGLIAGTPAYMAPEQVEGLRLTAAADLYAFGVVLYEMVTGRRPFESDTPLSLAVKHLRETPVPPRQLVPSLDPIWNNVILRCLEKDPAARYPSALDVVRALRKELQTSAEDDVPTLAHVSASPQPVRPPEPPKRKVAIVAAVLLVLAAVVAWRTISQISDQQPPAASTASKPVSMRRALAVFPLHNSSGRDDAAWLSTAIAEMLTTNLTVGGDLRLAPSQDVARVKTDLGVGGDRPPSRASLERIRRNLSVDSVVTGSYTLLGDPGSSLLRIDLQLADASTGRSLASLPSRNGTSAQLLDVVSRVAADLRKQLDIPEISPAQLAQVQASFPANPEAVRLYTQGLSRLRLYDPKGALEALSLAAKADPKHAFTRYALTSANSALGNETKAREEAQLAVSLGKELGPEQKLLIADRFHVVTKDWDRAIEVEKTLWSAFPDNVEYGINLADSQISAGLTTQAFVTIEAMRKLPAPVSLDPRIDLVEALAHQSLGDVEKQRAAAASAAKKARATGAKLLLARARLMEAPALWTLGKVDDASAALGEAQILFRETGDRRSLAQVLELTADFLSRKGDLEGDRRLLEQALQIHREIGNRSSVAVVLLNIGTILIRQGNAAESKPYLEESLATFREIGAKEEEAAALNDIGTALFNQGDLARAQARYEAALALFGTLTNKSGTATTMSNIGEVFACRAELEAARRMHEDALAINRAIADKAGIAYDLFRLGEIFTQRGDFVAARQRYDEALRLQNEVDDRAGAAITQVALGSLDLDEGKVSDASETSSRAAEETLRTDGAVDESALALAVLADTLLARGRRGDAQELANRAWTVVSKSENRRLRFRVATIAARVRAASLERGDVELALASLNATRKEAARTRFVVAELEARLAVAEIERSAGLTASRSHLAALEKDAAAKDLRRIARRASRLVKS